MREIKFRAWHKDKKIMCGVNGIYEGKYEPDKLELDIYNEKIGYQDYHLTRELDNIDLMQYTGLKDKNGKEIYEGDILYNPNDRYNYIIIWDDMQGAFSLGEDGCLLKKYCLNEFWEVVGNVYENLELLEAK